MRRFRTQEARLTELVRRACASGGPGRAPWHPHTCAHLHAGAGLLADPLLGAQRWTVPAGIWLLEGGEFTAMWIEGLDSFSAIYWDGTDGEFRADGSFAGPIPYSGIMYSW